MYAQSFIESDAAQILNLDWIDVPPLRKFLDQKILYIITPSTHDSMSPDPIHVRIETPHVSEPNTPSFSVKSELQSISLWRVSGAVKLRTLKQGGREILELISESEADGSDPDFDVEVTAALMRVSSRSSSTIAQSDAMGMCIVSYLFSHLLMFALDTKYRGPNDGGTHAVYAMFFIFSHIIFRYRWVPGGGYVWSL
jgi:hypothetical protein